MRRTHVYLCSHTCGVQRTALDVTDISVSWSSPRTLGCLDNESQGRICLSVLHSTEIIYAQPHGWIFHVSSGDHNSNSYTCVASSLLTGMSSLQAPIIHFELSAVSQLFSSHLSTIYKHLILQKITPNHSACFSLEHFLWTLSVLLWPLEFFSIFSLYTCLSFNFPVKSMLVPRSSVKGPSLPSS